MPIQYDPVDDCNFGCYIHHARCLHLSSAIPIYESTSNMQIINKLYLDVKQNFIKSKYFQITTIQLDFYTII